MLDDVECFPELLSLPIPGMNCDTQCIEAAPAGAKDSAREQSLSTVLVASCQAFGMVKAALSAVLTVPPFFAQRIRIHCTHPEL